MNWRIEYAASDANGTLYAVQILAGPGQPHPAGEADRGVVEVKCLGVCPKNAVVMIDGARPGHWMLVPAGTEPREVVAVLAQD